MKNTQKIFFILFLTIILIIIFPMFIKWILPGNKLTSMYQSPMFFYIWLVLSVIIISFYKKPYFTLILKTAVFIFAISLFILYLIIPHSSTFQLQEGQSISMPYLAKKLGFTSDSQKIITLELIEVKKTTDSIDYKSHLNISDNKKVEFQSLDDKTCLKIDNINIALHSIIIEIKELIFHFKGKEYNYFKTAPDSLITSDNKFFSFYPLKLSDNRTIIFKWQEKDQQDKNLREGSFQYRMDQPITELDKELGLAIKKIRYNLISLFDISYKFINLWIILSIMVFTASLIFTYWLYKRQKS